MGRYTQPADVASLLGRVFDSDQNAVADRVISAVEAWIDRETGKTYGVNSQTSQRFFRHPGPLLKLRSVPVVSVDGVFTRTSYTDPTEVQLVATAYDLQDANEGLVYVPSLEKNAETYPVVRVLYTAGNPVPPTTKLGTEYLAAHWMRPILLDEMQGIAQFSLGGEESITYSELVRLHGVPAEVWTLLGVNPGGAFYIA